MAAASALTNLLMNQTYTAAPYVRSDYQILLRRGYDLWKVMLVKNQSVKMLKRIAKHDGRLEMLDGMPHEFLIVRMLDHPNICKFEDLRVSRNCFYIIGEWFNSWTLRESYDSAPFLQVCTWINGVRAALRYCHANNVIHSNVKPHHILVGPASEVRLVDFGYAYLELAGDMGLHFYGSPSYMAPERYFIEREFDGRKADVWSFGVTMYETYFKGLPFVVKKPGPDDLYKQVAYDEPTYDTDVVDANVERYLALVRKMLAKSPLDRPALDAADYDFLAGPF